MTRRSILEYAEALRGRYLGASREEKGKMLDEFTKVTGLHRKAAIRLMHRVGRAGVSKRLGRPRRYGTGVAEALRAIWEASDRLCSRRLQPFLPEMIRVLRQHGEQMIDASTETQLRRMSPSTIDRLLRPCRKFGGRRGLSTTRPGSSLKNSIPIRTFADWQENKPGFMETDLVAHCGESSEGFYLNTLCAVDVASGWTQACRCGVRARCGYARRCIGCVSSFPSPCSVSTRTMAANSSTSASIPTVARGRLPLPGLVLTRRMTVVMWNKRMVM